MDISVPTPRFYLDQPTAWKRLPRCVFIRGWCFAGDGQPIRAIRLRAGEITLDAVVGLPRPDVKAEFANAPDDHTGFEIRGTLPSGRITVTLEAASAPAGWQQLMSRPVEIERHILPLWLGGGSFSELMHFQMPAHMAYPPRPVQAEKFPAATTSPARPKFSIVTPSYQQARFLAETVRSVVDQPGVDCQYVVQDGGSTDESAAIISAHAHRLHAWESVRDGGQADAIKRGFAKTSGGPNDVMAWINSDDYYQPGALAFVADYFARHPEVDVLYGHRIVVDESSREIARRFLPPHDDAVLRLNDFVPQETMFWRRRIGDQVGGLDASFHYAMDWDLLLRFSAAGARIVRVPYFLACFRVHPAQKTSAARHVTGEKELTFLRERAIGRPVAPQELVSNPFLLRYLRRSAWIELMWKLGIRTR